MVAEPRRRFVFCKTDRRSGQCLVSLTGGAVSALFH